MKNFLIFTVAVVALFGFGLVSEASACAPSQKNDVYFNIGSKFIKTQLSNSAPTVELDIEILGRPLKFVVNLLKTNPLQSANQLILRNPNGREQKGVLVPIYRCNNSPQYVIWEDDSDNPKWFGAAMVSEFNYFYENYEQYMQSKKVRFGIRLEAMITPEAAKAIYEHGYEITKTGINTKNGGTVDLQDKNYAFAVIREQKVMTDRIDRHCLVVLITTYKEEKILYAIDLENDTIKKL